MPPKRKKISRTILTNVLTKSRRRCCLCFGLHGDASLKRGQIAHIDKDPSNASEDNLAFFCLDHHDQYDSKTSQSKNFTANEVKEYRDDLYNRIVSIIEIDVSRLPASSPQFTSVCGRYIKELVNEYGEITIELLDNGLLEVKGIALWGTDRFYGPNFGEFEHEGPLIGDKIIYDNDIGNAKTYIEMTVNGPNMTVAEEGGSQLFGMNVTFAGVYQKI